MKHRTPAYWPTRILLAVGALATVISVALSLARLAQEPMFGPQSAVLGLPGNIAGGLAGLVLTLVGFAWMLRIFRGRHDEPPAWRYRDG